jgi:5-methylcytosine-specific restriction endonuclease McrA
MIERVISPEVVIDSFGLIGIALAFSRRLKEEIRKKQDNVCASCGKKVKKLQIHHIIPQSMGGPDTEDNAVGLCPNCHQEWDERAKEGKFFKKKK